MKLFEECRFCDKRYVGCHANCLTYIRDRKLLDEVKAKQRADNDYIGYVVDIIKRRRCRG